MGLIDAIASVDFRNNGTKEDNADGSSNETQGDPRQGVLVLGRRTGASCSRPSQEKGKVSEMVSLATDKSIVLILLGSRQTFVLALPLGLALVVEAQTNIFGFCVVRKRQTDGQRRV